MGFEKFGYVSYASQTRVSKFIDYLENEKVYASKCAECGAVEFPPRAHCPRCLSDRFEWKGLSGNCSLLTYSKVDSAPALFKEQAPYYLGLAELVEGPKIFAWLDKKLAEDQVAIGMKLQLKVVKLQNGQIIYTLTKPQT